MHILLKTLLISLVVSMMIAVACDPPPPRPVPRKKVFEVICPGQPTHTVVAFWKLTGGTEASPTHAFCNDTLMSHCLADAVVAAFPMSCIVKFVGLE